MGGKCVICGKPWEECLGECQDEITLEDKIEYLKSLERKEAIDGTKGDQDGL